MNEDDKIKNIQEELNIYDEKLYSDKNFMDEINKNITDEVIKYINNHLDSMNNNDSGRNIYYANNEKYGPPKDWIESNLASYYSYCFVLIKDFGVDINKIDTDAIERYDTEKCFKLWKLTTCKEKYGWKLPDIVAKEHLEECLLILEAKGLFYEIPDIIVETNPEECFEFTEYALKKDVQNVRYISKKLVEIYPERYFNLVQRTLLGDNEDEIIVGMYGVLLKCLNGAIIEKIPEKYLQVAKYAMDDDPSDFMYVDERIIEKYPEEYLKMARAAVEDRSRNLEYVSEILARENPEEYSKLAQIAIERSYDSFRYVSKVLAKEHPEKYLKLAQIAIEKNSGNFQFVDEVVAASNPEEYLKIARISIEKRGRNLEFVSKIIVKEHTEEYLKLAQIAIERSYDSFRYVSKVLAKEHPEDYLKLAQIATKKHPDNFQFVDEMVAVVNPMEYVKMAQVAIEKNYDSFRYVDSIIAKEHTEEYLKLAKIAVWKNPNDFQYVNKIIAKEYTEEYLSMAKQAVKDIPDNLKYVDEIIPNECTEEYLVMAKNAVEESPRSFKYVDKIVAKKNPKEYIDMVQIAINDDSENLKYISEIIVEEKPEEYFKIVEKIVKEKPESFKYVHGSIAKNNPEKYLKMAQFAVTNCSENLKYVDDLVAKEYPKEYLQMSKKAVNEFSEYIKFVHKDVEGYKDFCVECIKTNIDVYKYIDQDVRDSEEIKNIMFEDIETLERIKRKVKFEVDDEIQMDMFYHQMIKSIGLEETEKLVEIPNLSKEEVEKYGLEYDERLNELFEKKYKLKGETGAVIELFRTVDLKEFQEKEKNVQFEVYKNINKILEESDVKNLKISDIVKGSLEKSGIKNADGVVLKMEGKLKTIVGNLSEEKLDKTRNELVALLSDRLTSQQEPVRRIIEKKIKESLKEGEGIYNKEEIVKKIKEELARTRENGGTYYSPHIIDQEEKILQITKDFLENKGVERILQKSLTQTLKEQKEKMGKGWIRKVLGVPEELSKEEYENLERKLGIKLESSYTASVKQGIDESKAFELLREKSVPGVVTYLQIESMFSEMKEPYSEEFRKFYSKNKKEILEDPEIYRELSRMHNNFESIVNDPYVKKKYERGELSLENYMQILNDRKYENVKPGNERFADVAARAGLGKEKFEHVQEIWEKTKKREGTTIPQVKASNKKYKGRILRADEPLNLFVGNVTTCCQKSGDVGEGSMQHGSTERNGAIFVIEETDTNAVVGQSWVWRNNGRICFDNIEINNDIHGKMSDEDEKEILEIYQEAGEKAIKADKKVMERLLKEGKISQEVYDEVVLKEVTVGLNMYNDLKEMEDRLKDGRLKESKEIILPKEEKKIYKGESASGNAWIDSREKQVILASMDEREKEEIEKRRKGKKKEDIEVPVIYENMREIVECKGKKIYPEYVEKIKKVEGAVFREEQQMLQYCDNYEEIAERYGIEPEKMEVNLSRDGDWYVIGEERENEYYIPDMAMVGGMNSQKNEKIETDTKATTFELAYVMYKKLIEMGEKEKTVRYEATKDTSYVNTKRMEKKGLIEILSEEDDTFGNSDIEMKNVVVRPNVEKLKEELKKVERMLRVLEERGYQKARIDFDDGKRQVID